MRSSADQSNNARHNPCRSGQPERISDSISAKDKGLLALTLSVGCASGLICGLCGQIAVLGNGTTFSFYGLIFAVSGSALALFGYRRLIGV